MRPARAVAALLLRDSLAGYISARVDARDASREWAGVGKSRAEA